MVLSEGLIGVRNIRKKGQSIKFSYDMVCPTELQINVYKTEKDLNDNKQFCEIAYLLDEENGEYDIIHNPEKFILYVDGEKVE